ncbi:MAG: metal ABC transporter ATP-binding protein [Anaerolineales bacterium]
MPHLSHQTDQPILDVRHLSVRYGDHLALEDVTFHLHKGERVAVVGPNGAGKSTLFKVIVGVIRPTAGEVRIYGSQPSGHVCIGYVPQRSQVEWRFPVTVEDVVMMGRIAQIGFFRQPRKEDWKRVHQALETVGLLDLARRPIDALSGGQQQRMFIARALAQEAELLLMDEPLNGLDLPSQESILSLLEVLRAQQVTVMIATHDLDQAARFFDRIMLLNRRVIGFGEAKEVLRPERLKRAYGGKLQIVEEEGNLIAVGDTCCEEPSLHELR